MKLDPRVSLLILGVLLLPGPLLAQHRIYIDPGHGGADAGAINPSHGTREADRVLLTGLELRRLLERDTTDKAGGGSWTVRMSRSSDIFISLGARSADANAWGADRLLSIHQNAYNRKANGTETFSLNATGTAADLRNLVQAEAIKAWGLVNRGNKTAGFSVLRNSAMPAVLTEMGFIDTNPDHPFCASDEKCRLYAQHMLFAIQRHYGLKAYLPGAVTLTVDNRSAKGYSETGDWQTSPYRGFWGSDSRWANVLDENPPNTATFRPDLPQPGRYEVSAWWLAGANRSPAAGFVIHHASGSTTVEKDQRSGSKQWNVLGAFDFPAGDAGHVVLSGVHSAAAPANPSATVISSDAVRFVRLGDLSEPRPNPPAPPQPTPPPQPAPAPVPPPQPPAPPLEIIVDNVSPNFVAPGRRWFTATATPGYVGSNYHARRVESTSDPASWAIQLPEAGQWEVYARWPAGANRSESVPYVIVHEGGPTTRVVNQRKNDNTWVSLGTYPFAAGYGPRVLLSCWTRSGDFVIADAIRLVRR